MTVLQNNQRNALPSGLGGVSLQTEDRYTFTGKELDAESNLYYYDARYNSSTYSQFTSLDPMSDKYPSVSPYLYCAGNPIMYVDPTGMDWFQSDDKTAAFWNKSSEKTLYRDGEMYYNIGSKYVVQQDNYTMIYEQNQLTTIIMRALYPNDFETQMAEGGGKKQGDEENCFYQAGLMVKHSGNTSCESPNDNNNITDFDEQIKYTANQVSLGYSVRAHVDRTNDGKGDHWVAISYVTIDVPTQKVTSIGFYDPGTVHKQKGVNNYFTVKNRQVKGQPSYNKNYIYVLTAIRRNKK